MTSEEFVSGICTHCLMPIVLIDYIDGAKWMHRLDYDPNPEAEDLSLYCRTTVAQPIVIVEEET